MNLLGVLVAALVLQGGTSNDFRPAVDPARMARMKAAEPFFQKGEEQLNRGQYAAAIVSYRRALQEAPEIGLQVRLGEAYAGLKKWSESAEWYSQTVYPARDGKQPGPSWACPKPMLEYALVLIRLGKSAETLPLYEGALPGIYTDQGDMHVLLPTDYSPKLTSPQMEARVRLALALAFSDERTFLPNLEEAVRLDPKVAAAKYYLGKYLYEFRDKAKGRELLEGAVALDAKTRPAVDRLYKRDG